MALCERRRQHRAIGMAAVVGLTAGSLIAFASPGAAAATPCPAADWDALSSCLTTIGSGTGAIQLTAHVTAAAGDSLVLAAGSDVTLDLAGHVLTIVQPPDGVAAVATEDATFTLDDSVGGGQLTAVGGAGAAGIGGADMFTAGTPGPGGTIRIEGGSVTANGGNRTGTGLALGAAGIGAGLGGDPGTVTIDGGTVIATGGAGAAGIGGAPATGGGPSGGGTVTINGGDVTAVGGTSAGFGIGMGGAGIGGTSALLSSSAVSTATSITINAGTVKATGGELSPGIGTFAGTDHDAITIADGTVTATGGGGGAGIGDSAGTVTIHGGDITARGSDPSPLPGITYNVFPGGAGIGASALCAPPGVVIDGGTVTATGGAGGPGIGGGSRLADLSGGSFHCGDTSADVTITAGTVTATAGRAITIGQGVGVGAGAGIGGSTGGDGGSITIGGGTVTATGGPSAAGIGGGVTIPTGIFSGETGLSGHDGGDGGAIAIGGGTVTATGGATTTTSGGGAGIGGGGGAAWSIDPIPCLSPSEVDVYVGDAGAGGTVTIGGGTVTATGGASAAGIGGGGAAPAGAFTCQPADHRGGGTGAAVTIEQAATVIATGGGAAASALGGGGGTGAGGFGSLANAGKLTLHGSETLPTAVTTAGRAALNRTGGLITLDGPLGGAGSLVNEGTILLSTDGTITDRTTVTVHHYVVDYDLGDAPGTPPPTQTIYAASFADAQTSLPAPEWTGHTFGGWSTAASDGTTVTDTSDLSDDTLLGSSETGATAARLHALWDLPVPTSTSTSTTTSNPTTTTTSSGTGTSGTTTGGSGTTTSGIAATTTSTTRTTSQQSTGAGTSTGAGSSTGTAGSLTISPLVIRQGETITVHATGFAPGETVTAELHSTPLVLGRWTAGPDGSVNFVAAVPPTESIGTHLLIVVGQTSGHSAEATLTVTAAPSSTAATDSATAHPVTSTPGQHLADTGWPGGAATIDLTLALLATGSLLLLLTRRRQAVGRHE